MSALMLSNAFSAQTITYNLNNVSIGTIAPLGESWATVTLNEIDEDTITINISCSLTNGEFFSAIGFNLIEDFNYEPLTVSTYTSNGNFDEPEIFIGNDVKSGGAGIGYDIWFDFATSNSQGGIKRFNETDSFSYTIHGVNIEDFYSENEVVGHTQNLTDGASAWVTTSVPEPASMLLGSIGLCILLTNRKRHA